ncbi:hypothetical protein EDB19DRAFT_1913701 [Suillus lakei]|nr:hypothetical protein EDB19DRAFT_1913701 [Suillus lakei]
MKFSNADRAWSQHKHRHDQDEYQDKSSSHGQFVLDSSYENDELWSYLIIQTFSEIRSTRRSTLHPASALPTTLGLGEIPKLSTICTPGPSAIPNTNIQFLSNLPLFQSFEPPDPPVDRTTSARTNGHYTTPLYPSIPPYSTSPVSSYSVL